VIGTVSRIALASMFFIGMTACGDRHTSKLTPELEQRFASEGVARRADDLDFRYTTDPRGRNERWEIRRASIVVTKSSVFIHKNEKVGLEITPATRRDVSVERSANRIRIHSGRGQSEEIWSFLPPGDAPGWTSDIRSVINSSRGSGKS
jgi:hypothetical protein